MMSALQTPLTLALGSRFPIIQTAMGWVATAELVTASINAGAFGFLAAAVMTPEECEKSIRQIKDSSDSPFGVNFHSFQAGVERIADICIEHQVAAVSYGRAPSAKIIERMKGRGIKCVPTIGAARHAKKAVELGADVLVCQGREGGGHTGATPTWLLLAEVLDMDPGVPVVACGGFKDGRGLAAALTFGADGIAMGTRFLLTSDSPTPMVTKQAYLDSVVTGIPVSSKLDGLPQRMIMNERLRRLEAAGWFAMLAQALISGWRFKKEMGMSYPEIIRSAIAMAGSTDMTLGQTMMAANSPMIIRESMVKGNPEEGVLPSGQVAGTISDLPTCDALIADIIRQAESAIHDLISQNKAGVQHAV